MYTIRRILSRFFLNHGYTADTLIHSSLELLKKKLVIVFVVLPFLLKMEQYIFLVRKL